MLAAKHSTPNSPLIGKRGQNPPYFDGNRPRSRRRAFPRGLGANSAQNASEGKKRPFWPDPVR